MIKSASFLIVANYNLSENCGDKLSGYLSCNNLAALMMLSSSFVRRVGLVGKIAENVGPIHNFMDSIQSINNTRRHIVTRWERDKVIV